MFFDGYKKMLVATMGIGFFKRQCVVTVVIIIVHIIAPIMHLQKINQAYAVIFLLMLGQVLKKHGNLEQLRKNGTFSHSQK